MRKLGGGRVDELPEVGREFLAEDIDVEVVGEEEGDAVVFGDEVLCDVSDVHKRRGRRRGGDVRRR